MSLEEFYARLKTMPMTEKAMEELADALEESDPPVEVELIFEDDNRLVEALADRFSDIKTRPDARAFIDMLIGIGFVGSAAMFEPILEAMSAD